MSPAVHGGARENALLNEIVSGMNDLSAEQLRLIEDFVRVARRLNGETADDFQRVWRAIRKLKTQGGIALVLEEIRVLQEERAE